VISALLLLTGTVLSCEEPVPAAEIQRVLQVGRTAWVVMDRASFEAATLERRSLLPCLQEPISTGLAIEIHTQEALAWSLERRADLSQAAFLAILSSDPEWSLPLDLAPSNHRLHREFEIASELAAEGSTAPSNAVEDSQLLVDGATSQGVPSDRPFVAQLLDEQGQVVRSHYFTPGGESDKASWWLVPASGEGAGGLGPELPSRVRSPGVPLLVSAAGTGLLAGGLYAVAATWSGQLERGEVPCGEQEQVGAQVNQLVVASAALGAAGLGTGIAGIVVLQF